MTLSNLIDVLMENSQSGGKFDALAQHLLKVFIMRLIWSNYKVSLSDCKFSCQKCEPILAF